MKIRIDPYKRWSGGAKALGLRAGILRATNKQVERHGDFDIIINWGRTERRFKGEYINNPEAVARASDKSVACELFTQNEVRTPPHTADAAVAQKWREEGFDVLARTLTRASAGRGIELICAGGDQKLPVAPLYTKYIPKTTEYRVHVFQGKIIDVQEKRRRQEVPDEKVNWQIRNLDGGFVFCRDSVKLPACCGAAAISACAAVGLHFGAVDIGYNAKRDKCRVYEVNTAPGLEGSTLDAYYNALRGEFPDLDTGAYQRRRRLVNEQSTHVAEQNDPANPIDRPEEVSGILADQREAVELESAS
jgi:glutathione synthase/RimK-type ligase-like ATP-grasp enzyme